MEKGISGIYSIKCLKSERLYIGSAVCLKKRWNVHRTTARRCVHGNIRFQREWIKYGEANFQFSVLEYVADKTFLVAREQYWIDLLSPDLNLCPIAGSQLGVKRSKETLQKMSLVRKGKKPSEATREASRLFRTGRLHTEETKKKMRIAPRKRRRGLTLEERIAISKRQTGRKVIFTEQHKANLSKSAIGRKLSDEVKKKISIANKGNKKIFSDKHKANIKLAWDRRKELKIGIDNVI